MDDTTGRYILPVLIGLGSKRSVRDIDELLVDTLLKRFMVRFHHLGKSEHHAFALERIAAVAGRGGRVQGINDRVIAIPETFDTNRDFITRILLDFTLPDGPSRLFKFRCRIFQ
jgi:hypothetical protein